VTKFLTTAAMALAMAAVAVCADAQPNNNNNNKGQHAGAPGGQQTGGGKGQQRGGGPAGGQRGGGPAGGQHTTTQTVTHTNTQTFTGTGGQHGGPPAGGQHFGGPPAGRGGPAGMGFQAHGLRPQDHGRVTFRVGLFAPMVVVSQRYHAPPPAYPGGWYYRGWGYGDYLPFGWFTPGFYLGWANYGLPPPPIGCEWVREGQDAVLVDVWTGQVLSVYRGVFW